MSLTKQSFGFLLTDCAPEMSTSDLIRRGEFEILGEYLPDLACIYSPKGFQMEAPPSLFERLAPCVYRLRTSKLWRELSEAERSDLEVFLTHQHEMRHFFTLISTPAGFLTARERLVRCLDFVVNLRRITEQYGVSMIGIPLDKWKNELSAQRKDQELAAELQQSLLDVWNLFEYFRQLWSGVAKDSIPSATKIWNIVQQSMDMNTNLTFKQKACLISEQGQKEDLCSLPEIAISLYDILEMIALLDELLTLKRLGSSMLEREEWLKRKPADVIQALGKAATFLGRYDPFSLLIGLDLSLMAPVDPVYFEGWKEEYTWEDVQPSWRFWRILQLLKDQVNLTPDRPMKASGEFDQIYYEIADRICRELQWCHPKEVAEIGSKVQKHSNASTLSPVLFFLHFLDLHRTACSLRVVGPEKFTIVGGPSLSKLYEQGISPAFYFDSEKALVGIADQDAFEHGLAWLAVRFCCSEMMADDKEDGLGISMSKRLFLSGFEDPQAGLQTWKTLFTNTFGIDAESVVILE